MQKELKVRTSKSLMTFSFKFKLLWKM